MNKQTLFLIAAFLLSSRIVLFVFVFGIVLFALGLQNVTGLSYTWGLVGSFLLTWVLFLNVNPFHAGIHKHSMLGRIPKEYLPQQGMVEELTKLATIPFPIILKPTRCTGLSRGIFIVSGPTELESLYTRNDLQGYMFQEYIEWNNEATLLYEDGAIIAIVEKKGGPDDKVRAYCKNCVDITCNLTPELEETVRKVSGLVPGLYAGRYDIRYKSMNELQQGRFKILEINGSMGFDLRKDTASFPKNIYYTLRWFMVRLFIGLRNIIRGKGYSLSEFLPVMFACMKNTFSCGDWEQLFALYA